MSKEDVRTAWANVGDELSGLGLKLKLHAEEEFADDSDDEEIKSALERFGDAVEAAVEAVGDAAKDPAVRDDVRSAGHLMLRAMTLSINEAKSQLRPNPD